jgi:hypothetical protein
MVTVTESQGARRPTQSDSRRLNKNRRDALHQIICNKDISARTRIIARAIARLEYGYVKNGSARSSTNASDMTIRNECGCYYLSDATAAIDELIIAGHLRISKRENGTRDLRLVHRDDVAVYLPPINGDRKFWLSDTWKKQKEAREKLADAMFADPLLSDRTKLAGYAIMVLADPHTLECSESRATIASIVGIDKATAVRAVPKLIKRGYAYRAGDGAIGINLQPVQARCSAGAEAVQRQSRNPDLAGTSSPSSVNSVDSVRDVAGGRTYDSVEGQDSPAVVHFPDPATIANWGATYPFLMAGGPLGMIETQLASYIGAGFLVPGQGHFDYAITRLGHYAASSHESVSEVAAA